MKKPNFPQALFRGQPEKKWSFVFHEISAEARAVFSSELAKKYAFSEDECGEVLKSIPVLFLSGLVESTAQQFIRQWNLQGVKVALTEDEAIKQKCFQIIWPEAAPSADVALGKIKSEKYTSLVDAEPDYKNSDRGVKFLIQKLERRAAEPKAEALKETVSGIPATELQPNQKPIAPQVVAPVSGALLASAVSAEAAQLLKDELQKQIETNEKQKQIIEAQTAQIKDKQEQLERLQLEKAEAEKPQGEAPEAKQKREELENETVRLNQEIQKANEAYAQKESLFQKNLEEMEKKLAAAEVLKAEIRKNAERDLSEARQAKESAEAKLQALEKEMAQKQADQETIEKNKSATSPEEFEDEKAKPLPPAPIKSLLKQALQKSGQNGANSVKPAGIEKSQNDFKEKQAELECALEAEKAKVAEAEKKCAQALEDFNRQKEAWHEEAKQLGLNNQVLIEKMEKEAEALRDAAQKLEERALLAEEAVRKAEQNAEEVARQMKQITEQTSGESLEQALEEERFNRAEMEKKYVSLQEDLRAQEAKRQEETKELNLRNQKLLDKFEEEGNLLKAKIEELEKKLSSADALSREAGQRLEQALEEERLKTKEAERKNAELLEALNSPVEKNTTPGPSENTSEENKRLQNKISEIEKKLKESEAARDALEADKENEIKAMREALSEVYVHLLSQMKEDNQKKDLTIQAQAAELETLRKARDKSGA